MLRTQIPNETLMQKESIYKLIINELYNKIHLWFWQTRSSVATDRGP